jgi:hypothetical protein
MNVSAAALGGGAFKLILQAFPEMPGWCGLLCAMHSYQQ